MSDDLCRFEVPPDGAPLVHPSSPRLKLWRDALNELGRGEAGLERDHFREDKFHLPLPEDQAHRCLPLTAIYLLGWGEPSLTRLTGLTALRRCVESATYRGDLLEPMGQVAAHWERCAEFVKRVPVWELTRPRDLSMLNRTTELLKANWRDGFR